MAPMPTSALAVVTTVHLAIMVLRKHRTQAGIFPWAVLPSLVLCASPWLFPTVAGLSAGVAVHVIWFAVCERFLPTSPSAPEVAQSTNGSKPGCCGKGFVRVSVLAVRDETPTIRTFRLTRPDGVALKAGQFLTVRMEVNGIAQVRCYSVSSAPEAEGFLEISVKRQGLVSGALHATVQPGTHLLVKPPAGKFVYPRQDQRPIVLVAGGVGITPLISMIRHANVADRSRSITLFYSARGIDEFAFADELKTLGERLPNFRVIRTMTTGTPPPGVLSGRIDGRMIREVVPNAADSVFMMCGPGDMLRSIERTLIDRGVPPDRIRYEVFQATRAIGAAVAAGSAAQATHELTLLKTDARVDVSPKDTLLDAAESAGAEVPSLCRSGVCGTCRTRLVAGDATCTSDALDEGERAEGWVLPCVTWAAGDCTLDA